MILMKLKSILIGIIALLSIVSYNLYNKVNELDKQLSNALNNVQQYQSIVSEVQDENRVLQLTIDDFNLSKDSVLQELSITKDSLNIKNKELKQAISATTLITDTIIQQIPIETNFNVELKPNQLTTIKISRVDSTITCIPEIYNHQDLFIYNKKVYRNRYKNWFQRLIHFDFKKDKIQKYQIINSNNLLKVLDTRVVSISE